MTEYSYKTCPICGVQYAVDKTVMDYKHNLPRGHEHAEWFCPNGHNLIFAESEADRQRRRAERAEQDRARLEDELRLSQLREQKLKRRAAAALCPCCKRSFANVSRHIKHKHPEFIADNIVKLKGKSA